MNFNAVKLSYQCSKVLYHLTLVDIFFLHTYVCTSIQANGLKVTFCSNAVDHVDAFCGVNFVYCIGTVKPVLKDYCHERQKCVVFQDHTFLAEGPIFQYKEPVTRDHLSRQTTFLWPMGWSFKTSSTVPDAKCCSMKLVNASILHILLKMYILCLNTFQELLQINMNLQKPLNVRVLVLSLSPVTVNVGYCCGSSLCSQH